MKIFLVFVVKFALGLGPEDRSLEGNDMVEGHRTDINCWRPPNSNSPKLIQYRWSILDYLLIYEAMVRIKI